MNDLQQLYMDILTRSDDASQRLAESRGSLENPDTSLANPAEWLQDVIAGSLTAAGVRVGPESALRLSAVYACVRLLASTIASLPLHLYRRTDRGREKALDHPLYHLLHDDPNPEQTSTVWLETLHAHKELRGNCYAAIDADGSGTPTGLWPILPTQVRVERRNRRLWYTVEFDDGRERLAPHELLHVPHLGTDGLMGLSPVSQARSSLGLAIAAEDYGAKFFANSAIPAGVLETEQDLGDEGRRRLREQWEAANKGEKGRGTAVLEDGVKWRAISLNGKDTQFLELIKAKVIDVCRMYGVPPFMIGETEKSTSWGTGIEQQGIGFVVYTLRPRLVRWEKELNRKLLLPRERAEYFFAFDVNGLLRGDMKARFEAYAKGRQWGLYTRNEIRAWEDLPSVDGGDDLLTPLNMQAQDRMSEILASVRDGVLPNNADVKKRVAMALGLELEDSAFERQLNPNLVQRAFLEAPVLKVDELRQMIGLPALGGEAGEKLISIAQEQGDPEPDSDPEPDPPDNDPDPDPEEDPDGGSSDEEDDDDGED
jgi:HK97 family phage portal protein